MPRGAKDPSEVFASVLAKARDQLLLEGKDAREFEQKGIRGDERAAALRKFLCEHLPTRFSVTKGEVIDYADARSSQLDLIIYDAHGCAPIKRGEENQLIPAEALYAVIEVKTTLDRRELLTCYKAAKNLRTLRPFKGQFVAPRKEGAAADKNPRLMYAVFAYFSDLGENNWLEKEFRRVIAAAKEQEADVDAIDRVFVLSRGLIVPGDAAGKEEQLQETSVFLDFYLHVVNFLAREVKRRPPVDWQMYGPQTSPDWKRLA
jgi:hypothetical protein